MDWDLPKPFTMPVTVAEQDIDGLGHANNTCYVTWCERCAWQHSAALGLSIDDYQRLDRGVAIRHAEYDYYRPSFVADALLVGTWLVACDRIRLQRQFQVLHAADGVTLMRGKWELVSMVLSTGKAIRLPARFVETYAAAVVPETAAKTE